MKASGWLLKLLDEALPFLDTLWGFVTSFLPNGLLSGALFMTGAVLIFSWKLRGDELERDKRRERARISQGAHPVRTFDRAAVKARCPKKIEITPDRLTVGWEETTQTLPWDEVRKWSLDGESWVIHGADRPKARFKLNGFFEEERHALEDAFLLNLPPESEDSVERSILRAFRRLKMQLTSSLRHT